jgi:mannosyl-3-phosphoglycerate phosphatase
MNCIVITDLDGTLLDHDTYSFAAAMPALRRLKREGIPVIPCTSKTRTEMEYWMSRLQLHGPFVVENGGAVYVPRDLFPFPLDLVPASEEWSRLELGVSYERLRAESQAAALESKCTVSGFGDWSVEEIAAFCELPLDQRPSGGGPEPGGLVPETAA